MAGFEVIVRPVILPVIRPARARLLAPADDPAQGITTLSGSGGKLIDLTFSETNSWSKSHQVETQRTVDRERVYQKKPPTPEHPEGEIERENYIDVERVRKLEMRGPNGELLRYDYALPSRSDNVEVLQENVTIKNPNAPPAEGGDAAP